MCLFFPICHANQPTAQDNASSAIFRSKQNLGDESGVPTREATAARVMTETKVQSKKVKVKKTGEPTGIRVRCSGPLPNRDFHPEYRCIIRRFNTCRSENSRMLRHIPRVHQKSSQVQRGFWCLQKWHLGISGLGFLPKRPPMAN